MRQLQVALGMVFLALVLGALGPYLGWADPEAGSSMTESLELNPRTSVPYDGGSTPAGTLFFTHTSTPPSGFDSASLYLYDGSDWTKK